MTSSRKAIANRENAIKSPGHKTARGKKNSAKNAVKHGFYSRELIIDEKDKPEFESLRESLLAQLDPSTALQGIAFEQIVSSCWRCKLAMRLEMHRLRTWFTPGVESEESDSDKTGSQRDVRALQLYGASREDLRKGVNLLTDLRTQILESGAIHLTDRKEELVKRFGVEFYEMLEKWTPSSLGAIHMATMIDIKTEKFDMDIPAAIKPPNPDTPSTPESPIQVKFVADPQLQLQMAVKLIELQMQHILDIRNMTARDPQGREQAPNDFVPRYFASASRDLRYSVDWFLYLKSKGL